MPEKIVYIEIQEMKHRIPYHLESFRERIRRLRHNIISATTQLAPALGIVRYIAAIACLTAILLYIGFTPDTMDKRLIMKIVHATQSIFIICVVFDLFFGLKKSWSGAVLFRRLIDIIMILTLVPVVGGFCTGSHSWLHFIHTRAFLFICLGVYSVAELCNGTMRMLSRRTNPSLILSASFLVFIFIGSFILMLPRCTTGHLRYIDSLFMAASAVSMTGMSTVATAQTFTPLGWAVIAVLMQIGALGVLTFTSFFALFFSGRTSIYNQLLMRDFVYSKSMGALVPVILYILGFTLSVEALGALCLYLTLPAGFPGDMEEQVFFSIFHSMSAFCNCGFTTLPDGVASSALMNGNQTFYLVMTALILAGGLGFPNLVNLRDVLAEYLRRIRCRITGRQFVKKAHIYDLNTRLVMIFSAIFFIGGALAFYILEYNHAFAGLSPGRRTVQAIFCSATVRTAGFITYGPDTWLAPTLLIAMFMMWVGCASQSMGGGIKINAFAAVVLNLRSIVFGQKGVAVFGRSVSSDSIRRANAVVIFFIFALVAYACVIMVIEPELPGLSILFECFSALTTVGMSAGITPYLGDAAKIVLASAMFLGRVGIISVLCGVIGNRPDNSGMLPSDDIIIN